MDWKTNIISQIKIQKDQSNIYEQIISHCKEEEDFLGNFID